MELESFNLFSGFKRELNLIRVVDHLLCGHTATEDLVSVFNRDASNFCIESGRFGVFASGVSLENSLVPSIRLMESVAKLAGMAIDFGASTLVLPEPRDVQIKRVFDRVALNMNQIAGAMVVAVASEPYLSIRADLSAYNVVPVPNLFMQGTREIWSLYKHREVA